MGKNESSFFKKLLGKLGRKKRSSEFDNESENSFEFSDAADSEDDHIERELQNRPPTQEFPAIPDEFDNDDEFDSPPEVFQMTDEQRNELDEFESTIEQPAPQNTKQVTEDRPIDLEAIKNYQMTEEDEQEDSELGDYQEFTPTQETPGLTRTQKIILPIFYAFKRFKFKSLGKSFKNKSSSNFSSPLKKLPSWDSLIDKTFAARSRPRVHHIFLFVIVMGATYTLGNIVAVIMKGAPNTQPSSTLTMASLEEQKNYQSGIAQVRSNNLFNAKMKVGEAVVEEVEEEPIDFDLVCDTATRNSSLPITLINTTVLQDSVKSIASVQLRGSRDLKNFREGEKINNMAEISRINRLKVILKNLETGECEYVATEALKEQERSQTARRTEVVSPEEGRRLMEESRDQRIVNEGDNFKIERSVRDEMLANINEVLTQARAVQIRNPDGSYSFKMTEIVPGSIYTQLGIQNDDIITGINGDKISNVNELMSMFGRIRDIDNFEIQVQRDGSNRALRYEFE